MTTMMTWMITLWTRACECHTSTLTLTLPPSLSQLSSFPHPPTSLSSLPSPHSPSHTHSHPYPPTLPLTLTLTPTLPPTLTHMYIYRGGEESGDPWDFPGTVRVSSNNQEGEVMEMLSDHAYTPSPSSAAIPTEPRSESNGTALGGDGSSELEGRHSLQSQQEEEDEEEGMGSVMALPRRPQSQNLASVVLPVLDQVRQHGRVSACTVGTDHLALALPAIEWEGLDTSPAPLTRE